MIANSLHFFVECGNKDVSSRLSSHRQILKTARVILRRQKLVFDQAMKSGSDNVPFNPELVNWANKAKVKLANQKTLVLVTTNQDSSPLPSTM